MGVLADKLGIRNVFIYGLLLFMVVYLLFGLSSSTTMIYISFFLYGIYAASTEGISKAWISNMAHHTNTATAIGFYTSCQSICALLASAIAGWIWTSFGSSITFFISAVTALIAVIYLLLNKGKNLAKE
jgi:MFS family permease